MALICIYIVFLYIYIYTYVFMYVGILILVPVYRVLSSDSVPTVDRPGVTLAVSGEAFVWDHSYEHEACCI